MKLIEMEEKAREDYRAHLGKQIRVSKLIVPRPGEDDSELVLDQPVICQVTITPDHDVTNSFQDGFVDPYWTVRLLEGKVGYIEEGDLSEVYGYSWTPEGRSDEDPGWEVVE